MKLSQSTECLRTFQSGLCGGNGIEHGAVECRSIFFRVLSQFEIRLIGQSGVRHDGLYIAGYPICQCDVQYDNRLPGHATTWPTIRNILLHNFQSTTFYNQRAIGKIPQHEKQLAKFLSKQRKSCCYAVILKCQ